MKMIKRVSAFLFFLMTTNLLVAQDVVFSQFYASPMQINPALVGTTYNPKVILNYRNQWPNLSNAYISYSASYGQFFNKINSGLGLSILTDVAGGGIYNTTSINGYYSYTIKVNRDFQLKAGIEGAVVSSRVNWDKLVFPDQLDPITGTVDGSGNPINTDEIRPNDLEANYFDVSTGILASSKYFYAGISLKHINSPDESIISRIASQGQVPVRITLHGGGQIDLGQGNKGKKSSFISPNVLLAKQGEFYQVNLGGYFKTGMIYSGLWYRHTFGNQDAAIFLVGFQKDVVKIGYSYDLTVSNLGPSSGGAHEISLILNFDETELAKRRNNSRRYNDCLQIFR